MAHGHCRDTVIGLFHSTLLAAALLTVGCAGGGGDDASADRPPPTGGMGSFPHVPPPPPPPPEPEPGHDIVRTFHLDPPVAYGPTGDFFVRSTAIGDVTGDGRPDLVVMTEGSDPQFRNLIMVYPQTVDRTLGPPVTVHYLDFSAWQAAAMALGDLDRDGAQEILVAHQLGVSVARFQADSQTITLRQLEQPGGFLSVTASDVDDDGFLDVVAQTASDGAMIYKGDGAGGISPLRPLATPLAGYNHVISRDMDGDGKDDLVLTNGQGFQFWYLMPNDGAGGYGAVQRYELPRRASDSWPWMAWGVDVGDFNQDGRKDVAVSLSSNRPAGVGIYLRQADGQYLLQTVLDSFDLPEPIAVADIDGNGLDDIVTVHGGFSTLGYYLQGVNGFDPEVRVGIGRPTYQPTSSYRPDGLALGDLDSDGCLDVAIADYQFGVLVLAGKDCKRAPAANAGINAARALQAAIRAGSGRG